MRRRSLITFVVLNVFISLGVAFAVISLVNPGGQGSAQTRMVTVEIKITATTDPLASPMYFIVTATPLPGQPPNVGVLPTGLVETPDLTNSPVATFDPEIIGASVSLQETGTALPQNCILHTVASGDTPFGIAEQYGADGFALMEINGMDEATAANLQIGDTLIVPLEGCALTAEDVAAGEDEDTADAEAAALDAEETEAPDETATATVAATVRPTMTIPPTATDAQVTILDVPDSGDVTAEGVEIQNTGDTVNIVGWTLTDAEGNTFTFPEQFLFSNARVTVYTRTGRNTAIAFYWGRDEAVWEPGDVVTLRDDEGAVQSTFRIPRPVDLQ